MMDFFFAWTPIDLELSINGEEESLPSLLEVSSFLYDYNLGYELSRLATDPDYDNFRFSHYALYRKARPLANEARLRVIRLSHTSPIAIQTVLWGAPLLVGALWGVVQIIEKVSNWRLNREKLQLELTKLRRDNEAADLHKESQASASRVIICSEDEFLLRIRERDAAPLLDQVTKRLQHSTIRVKDMEIRFVRRSIRVEEK